MKKVKIIRSLWDRGATSKCKLLTDDGKMCCLGFVAKAEGYTDDEIRGQAMPTNLPDHDKRFKSLAPMWNASSTNDSDFLTEEQREKQVKEVLSRMGYDAEFED